MVLIAYPNREGSDEPAESADIAGDFAAPMERYGKVGYIRTDSHLRTATLFVSYFKYWNKKVN